jgi:hypothetical protein
MGYRLNLGLRSRGRFAEPGAHGEAVLGVGAGGATPSRHGGPGVSPSDG